MKGMSRTSPRGSILWRPESGCLTVVVLVYVEYEWKRRMFDGG